MKLDWMMGGRERELTGVRDSGTAGPRRGRCAPLVVPEVRHYVCPAPKSYEKLQITSLGDGTNGGSLGFPRRAVAGRAGAL